MDSLKVFYLDHLRSLCARAETPTSLVDGKSLDEHAHFVRHRLSEKGRLLQYHINSLLCYACNLCGMCDFTCCSKNPKKHLPYLCEFDDNEILSSYTKGVYSYYDIEQIEEFVVFLADLFLCAILFATFACVTMCLLFACIFAC